MKPQTARQPNRRLGLPAASSSATFRPDIAGLRAVAVLLVVASHVLNVPAGGYIGVDVFFVLSGFLITGLLLREHARTGRINLREFYARRARRLLPAAVLVLAVTNLAAWLVFTGERAGQSLRDALWSLGFLANVRFASVDTNYFDQARPPSPVQHYWSLAVEEQFYLVWPLLLLMLVVVTRRRRRTLMLLVAALTATSLTWSVLLTRTDPIAAYFSTPARAWELGVGALLALLLHHQVLSRLSSWAGSLLIWLGLAGIVAAALSFDEQTAFPGSAALLPVVGTAMVLLGGTAGKPNFLLVNPISNYLGRVSYSLYLWHWPVLVISSAVLSPGPVLIAIGLFGSLALAALCHHLVEEPVRHSRWLSRRDRALPRPVAIWRRRPARTAVAVPAVVALFAGGWVLPALALVSTAPVVPSPQAGTTGTTSPPETLAQLEQAVASSTAPAAWPALSIPLETISRAGAPEWIDDHCDNVNDGNIVRCSYGPANAAKTAVVVGDSIATSWLPALRARLEPRGWRLQVLTRNQCPNPLLPLYRSTPTRPFVECTEHKDWVLAQVRALRPELIVMSNAPTFLNQQVNQPQGAERFTQWSQGLGAAIASLRPFTQRVVVLGPPPRAGNLQSCVTRLSSPADCTLPLDQQWQDLRIAERDAAGREGADYLDPERWFCADGQCPAVVDSTPVYTDGRHLTALYSRRLAPHLGAALDRR